MKILLVGGGTGGSVSALISVAEEIKHHHEQAKFLFVGTKQGPEKIMAEQADLPFVEIVAGKWRRYFSLANLFTPFLVIFGFIQALVIIKKFRPNCIFGTGGFVQVPVIWAGKISGVPSVIHQQDFVPSLANVLCQIPAKKITVTFEKSLTDFTSGFGIFYKKPEQKILLTGNPFRKSLRLSHKDQGVKEFGLSGNFPVLLVVGGGTGAEFINKLVVEALPDLAKVVEIIHVTGKNKLRGGPSHNYHPFEFIANMGPAYAAADIVLSRAGLSTITELANLKKVSIIVPMPNSHQEFNAALMDKLQAAIVLDQEQLNDSLLVSLIRKLLFNYELQQKLMYNIAQLMPHDSAEKIANVVVRVAEQ